MIRSSGLVFGETLIGRLLAITGHFSLACDETFFQICLLAVYGTYTREFSGLGFSILGVAPLLCTLVQGVLAFGAVMSGMALFNVHFAFIIESFAIFLPVCVLLSVTTLKQSFRVGSKHCISAPTLDIVVGGPLSSPLSDLPSEYYEHRHCMTAVQPKGK
ncbi:hypothetical protein BDV06DRAFT_40528 [Aspergillus oleicola]